MSSLKDDSDRIDEALGAWPAPRSADERDWDAAARNVVTRLQSNLPAKSKLHLSDDELLAPPLPQGSEEKYMAPVKNSSGSDVPSGRFESMNAPSSGRGTTGAVPEAMEAKMGTQVVRQRDRSNFKDLAEMAATPPPSSSAFKLPVGPMSSPAIGPLSGGAASGQPVPSSADPNDSGLVDLQMVAAADPHGAERAKTTVLASAGLFDEEPGSIPPPSMNAQVVADAVPISGHMPVSGMRPVAHADVIIRSMPSNGIAAAPATQENKKKKRGLVVLLGSVVALAAMAAGVAFFVKVKGNPLAHQASPPVAVAVQAPEAVPATPAAPVVAAPVAADPSLEGAKSSPTSEKLALAPKQILPSKSGGNGKSAPPSAPSKPSPASLGTQEEKPVAAAPGAPGDLKGAMRTSVGPEEKQVQAAAPTGPEFAPGMVPQKPSQGAVAGAIGAVLQNARTCLGPDDPISKALVVFGSSGAVSAVTVTGHAAGTPAEACIKTAFSKAKVNPFAESTYSANVTVRPL